MGEDRTDSFLKMIRRAQRGRLKVYLGYSAGVGKTYQMLLEGHRLKTENIDVAIGLLETHGRVDIARLAEGLEIISRRLLEYRGIALEEMDIDAILTRRPQVALIDELAHTNAPGSRNPKRYQDVQDILAAGIHVITTMNVQHLESLYNTVEKAVGVKVRERLPDSVLAEADQIVDVDLTPEDLRKRLEEGKIYPPERIGTALINFFKVSNLENLRELTLRELASQIDLRRRVTPEEESSAAPDQVMVCLSSRGPNSEKLLRYASRLAGRLNRNWYAVYVQTPSEEPTVIDSRTQRLISETLTLAKQLGALVFTYKGENVSDTILRFAKEYRVSHVVIGRPTPKPFWKRLGKNRDIIGNLIENARGITLIVLDTHERQSLSGEPLLEGSGERAPTVTQSQTRAQPTDRLMLSRLLSLQRVVIWGQPVRKETVLRSLTKAIGENNGINDVEASFKAVMKREEQGSTFLNEGAAFPHARIEGLATSVVAIGLTKYGVSDVSTGKPIEIVFLIFSPADNPDSQIEVLSLVGRAGQSRHLLHGLRSAETPQEAMKVILDWEALNESKPSEMS